MSELPDDIINIILDFFIRERYRPHPFDRETCPTVHPHLLEYYLEKSESRKITPDYPKSDIANRFYRLYPNLISSWSDFSYMCRDIRIFEENIDKIEWFNASMNKYAGQVIERNIVHTLNNHGRISLNPAIVHFLENNIELISWVDLCSNEGAARIIESNPKRINWSIVSRNPGAIDLIEGNVEKICWRAICLNKNALHIMEKNIDKLIIIHPSGRSPVLKVIRDRPEKISDWSYISDICSDIEFMERNVKKLDFHRVSWNIHAVPLLEKNLSEVLWDVLSGNKSAVRILEANPKRLDRSIFDRAKCHTIRDFKKEFYSRRIYRNFILRSGEKKEV